MLNVALPLVLFLAPPTGMDASRNLQPSPRPVAWELEFRFLDPKRIEVQIPGTDRTETYWYVVYTVSNNTGAGLRFFPIFQIVTEDLQVFDTDMGISPLVFDAIRERHRITHKYLVEPTRAVDTLLTGEDNARESVAIWRDIDLSQNSFKLYVSGLSGEIRTIPNPSYRPDAPETALVKGADGREREQVVNPRVFTLRKTLEVRYNLPGSPRARPVTEPERSEVRWILR